MWISNIMAAFGAGALSVSDGPNHGLNSDCHSTIEFHISCTNLKKMDTFSNSDPFCVVYVNKAELGRTEVIRDTQNPKFTHSFVMDYFFEEIQTVRVEVYDEDKKGSSNLKDHDHQGSVDFHLGYLIGQNGQSITVPIAGGRNSTMTIHAEEVAACSEFLSMQLKGTKLKNKEGMFGKSDPFFIFSRVREDGSWSPVYKSPVIPNNLNPVWPLFTVSLQKLSNGDYERPLKIEVFDHEKSGNHKLMGTGETTVRGLLDKGSIPISEKKKSSIKSTGTIQVLKVSNNKRHTFLDYIEGGWEINMVVGIDFTGSNGNPALPGTLHYVDKVGGMPNPYQQTIHSLTDILTQYDNDQLFPCYGFGGRSAKERKVSHCFPLNGNPGNPYAKGVSGILAAYSSALTEWGLSGPTIFAQIITAARSMAASHVQRGMKGYTVLLIITDGVINDMAQTKEAIVAASDLPLSIIIVGVGDADFSNMEELDGDNTVLSDAHGRKASRDLVQFVKFNDFARAAPGRLAKETLAELPTQMMA